MAGCCTRGGAPDPAAEKLPLWRIFLFVAPNVPQALLGYVRGTLIAIFYVNTVGVSLFDIALARFFAGILVLYVQAAVGYLSDNMSGFLCISGRRRPWIMVGGPLVAVASGMLLAPPDDPAVAKVWLFICLIAANGLSEAVSVPYGAWTVELTQDPDRRSLLYTIVGISGTLSALGAALLAGLLQSTLGAKVAFKFMGYTAGAMTAVAYIALALVVKESSAYVGRSNQSIIPAIRTCLENAQWTRMLAVSLAAALLDEIVPLMVYVLNYAFQVDGAAYMSIFVSILTAAAFVALVGAGYLMTRFERRTVVVFSCCIVFLWTPLTGLAFLIESLALFYIASACLGLGLGVFGFAAGIMVSDCVDLDEVLTGQRRESVYTSLTAIPSLLLSTMGSALPLMALYATGFVGGAGGLRNGLHKQNAATMWVIQGVTSIIPGVVAIIVVLLVWPYKLTRAVNKRVVAFTTRMRAAQGISDDEVSDASLGQTLLEGDPDAAEAGEDDATATQDLAGLPLYFSHRDLRMLAAGWRWRFLGKYVLAGALWLASFLMGAATVGILLSKSTDDTTVANNATLIIAAIATVASLGVVYEALRLSAVSGLWSLSKADVAGWLADRVARKRRLARLQALLMDTTPSASGDGEAESDHLSAMLELTGVPGAGSAGSPSPSLHALDDEEDGLLADMEDGEDDKAAAVPAWLPIRVLVRLLAIHLPFILITATSLFIVTHYDVWGTTKEPTHVGPQ